MRTALYLATLVTIGFAIAWGISFFTEHYKYATLWMFLGGVSAVVAAFICGRRSASGSIL